MTSILMLALAACTTQKKSSFVDAASTPLRDLNIVRADIPEVLREAKKHPYLAPSDQSCEGLSAAVRTLDEVLGPDLDAPASPSTPRLLERANKAANEAAVNAVQGAAEEVLPFRGWVRQLSGALLPGGGGCNRGRGRAQGLPQGIERGPRVPSG